MPHTLQPSSVQIQHLIGPPSWRGSRPRRPRVRRPIDRRRSRHCRQHVGGTASGTGRVVAAPDCNFATQHFDLTIDTVQRRDSSLSIDVCIVFLTFIPPDTFARFGIGTFVLTLPSGATLTGTLEAAEVGTGDPQENDMDVDLTAISGTRRLQNAIGTLMLTGTWGPLTTSEGNFTGTLTSNLAGKP
jgi:hypothetical protein